MGALMLRCFTDPQEKLTPLPTIILTEDQQTPEISVYTPITSTLKK